MRATRLVVLTALAAAAGALYACGSDTLQDGTTGPAGDAGLDVTVDVVVVTDAPVVDTSLEPTDSSPDVQDSGAPDVAPDVAFDAKTIPEGGVASDPGHVDCVDAAPCSAPANECCVASSGVGTCKASSAACGAGSVASLKCDEAANCADAGACCATLNPVAAPYASAACSAAACTLGQVQLCHTNGECPNHDCTPQTCTFGTTKVRVEACGLQTLAGCTK